jgi:ribosomal protein L40E
MLSEQRRGKSDRIAPSVGGLSAEERNKVMYCWYHYLVFHEYPTPVMDGLGKEAQWRILRASHKLYMRDHNDWVELPSFPSIGSCANTNDLQLNEGKKQHLLWVCAKCGTWNRYERPSCRKCGSGHGDL